MSWISFTICSLAWEHLNIFDRITYYGSEFTANDELIKREVLDTLMEARVLVEGWRKEYNRLRPHSSLGYRPLALEAYEVEKFTQGLVY